MIKIYNNNAINDKNRVSKQDNSGANSSGMVLVTVIIFVAAAGIIAAGLNFASGSRIKQVQQELRFDKAFFVAEAGVERAKAALRNGGTNNGVLFGGTTNYGEGTFYVNVWPTMVGTNEHVIIRSTGTVEAVNRIIEVEVRVTLPSAGVPGSSDGAVAIYGTNASVDCKNENTHIDGRDYLLPDWDATGEAGAGTLSGNPTNPGLYYSDPGTKVPDSGTIEGDPPMTNWAGLYDETYWFDFVDSILPYAVDYTSADALGTRDIPQITLLPSGETKLNGNAQGAGILIVPGGATLKCNGTFRFEGLLIIIGDGIVDTESELTATGTFDLFGSVIGLGGALDFKSTGNCNMKYSQEALDNLSRLPIPAQAARLEVISWKEIKASSAN